MLGRDVDGVYVEEHQRKLRLNEFDQPATGTEHAAEARAECEPAPEDVDPALKFWTTPGP